MPNSKQKTRTHNKDTKLKICKNCKKFLKSSLSSKNFCNDRCKERYEKQQKTDLDKPQHSKKEIEGVIFNE